MTLFCNYYYLLFCFLESIMMKPSFLYQKDGSLRKFGIGYKQKTILTIMVICHFVRYLVVI